MDKYEEFCGEIIGQQVKRPDAEYSGTLSGHLAGQPVAGEVYRRLKEKYAERVFRQYEFLNALYLKNKNALSAEQRNALIESGTVLYLITRGDKAVSEWNEDNPFTEKQNDTADMIYYDRDSRYFELIDVKSHNEDKVSQPPNIISAYKLAETCRIMLENKDFSSFEFRYIEVFWKEEKDSLVCTKAYTADLFRANPDELYINWTAAMQIQFFVHKLSQNYGKDCESWAKDYLKFFVDSAKNRLRKMNEKFIKPYEKWIE